MFYITVFKAKCIEEKFTAVVDTLPESFQIFINIYGNRKKSFSVTSVAQLVEQLTLNQRV